MPLRATSIMPLDVTTPMMMPTAISITLPRLMNSLNSARRLFMVDPFLRETFCQGIMPLFCRVSIAL